MLRARVIPTLLLDGKGLYKTQQFKNPVYIGDPINAVKIFNDKAADELVILDISATRKNSPPDIAYLKTIASEAFMPLSFGGGISTVAQVRDVLLAGFEKVVLNSHAHLNHSLITAAAKYAGSSAITVGIDVRKKLFGGQAVYTHSAARMLAGAVVEHAAACAAAGAGEIMLTAVDRDGTLSGFDLDLIAKVASTVQVPVILSGGGRGLADFQAAFDAGASGVAVGAAFVFQGKHRAVLISYPNEVDITNLRPN